MNRHHQAIVVAAVILIALIMVSLLWLVVLTPPWRQQPKEEAFSEFLDQVDRDTVSSVKIFSRDQTIEIQLKNGQRFKTAFPAGYNVPASLEGKVKTVEIDPQNTSNISIVVQLLPLFILPVLLAVLAILVVMLVLNSGWRWRKRDSESSSPS